LEIFYTATETLSGSKYPTSHLYFFQLWNIKKVLNTEESVLNRKILNEEASSQDTIAHMVEQMQTKFNLYWKEIYMSACIPVILDPRYKYDFLEYHLSDFGSEKEADTWMSEVKNTMQKLFNEYNQLIFGEMQDCDIHEVQDVNDPLAEWDQYMKSKRRQSSNELDQYLKEKLTPRREEIDILKWWKGKSEIYPVLSVMARDILAIPASTVPSESAFSTGGRVVSDYRSSLAPTTIEALICLQDWFKAAGMYFFAYVLSFGSYNIFVWQIKFLLYFQTLWKMTTRNLFWSFPCIITGTYSVPMISKFLLLAHVLLHGHIMSHFSLLNGLYIVYPGT
jgi:hypothetical protein